MARTTADTQTRTRPSQTGVASSRDPDTLLRGDPDRLSGSEVRGPALYPPLHRGPERRLDLARFWAEPGQPAHRDGTDLMRRSDLKTQLAGLPASPGVYQFYDDRDALLYVGKALVLKSRVRSYFQDSSELSVKVEQLVERIARIEWIVTATELEALLLEMNLIKTHRPRFNVVLKDDKRYPFIRIQVSDPFPKVEATRHVASDGARYFGPYTSAGSLYETLDTLRKVFPYLTCNRTITGTDERSCLYDDLGLCAAPCVAKVNQAEYRAIIDGLTAFLQGDTQPVIRAMQAEMTDCSERLEFEQAARIRDRLAAIRRVIARQRIIAPTMADQDVVAVARDDANAIAQVFFVREGRVIGREHYPLAGAEDEPLEEVISYFLLQFYEGAGQVPGEVIVPAAPASFEALEAWLTDLRGARVKIVVPHRGRKRGLLQMAAENAADTLRAMDAWQGDERGLPGALSELQTALDLPRPPLRIECFDISTLQGTNTVGSMVVFQDGATARSDYRRFRIRSASADDDFACLEEVLTRRFTRLERYRSSGEAAGAPATAFERTPDLVVIDGGKGQLGVAQAVLSRLGMDDIPLASLAKRNEELYRPGRSTPVRLPQDSGALHMVQRLRDEAHRFAITYHRSLRRSAGMASSLDDIPGVGSRRRRALLSAFGSLDGIRAASVDELAAVPTMTRSIAEKVKAAL